MVNEQPLHLLIVEDSEDDAELLLIELKRNGLTIARTERVESAAQMSVALDTGGWDIIISDHNMPGFSAFDALTLIQSRQLDIPFIILSGAIGEDTAVQAMRAGAHDYILKGRLARLIPAIHRELQEAEERRKRRLAEEENRKIYERLTILHDIDMAILAAHSTEEIAASVIQRLCRLLKSRHSLLLLVDPADSTRASVIAHAQCAEENSVELVETIIDDLDISTLPPSLPIAEPLHSPDGVADGPIGDLFATIGVDPSPGFIITPMYADGNLEALLISVSSGTRFVDEQIVVMREIADQMAVAIRQAQLHRQIENHALELEARVAERTKELQEATIELEAFAHSVSYDLRAPLRAVQGYIDVLQEEYGPQFDSQAALYIESISDGARRMDLLIKDLLIYSQLRLQGLRLWPVSLSTTVTNVLSALAPDVNARKAEITVEEPLPRVTGDPEIIASIVRALLMNALTFVEEGVQPRITVRAESDENRVRLLIEDNGIGVPAEYQEQIFRIFERLHRPEQFEGNGIGLAIVRKGMERMGGKSGVISDGTNGSTFWLEWSKKGAPLQF